MKCFALIFIAVFVLGQTHGGVIDSRRVSVATGDEQLKTTAAETVSNLAGVDRDERQLFGLPVLSQSGASSQSLGASLGGLLNLGLSQSQASSAALAGAGTGASSNSKATSIGAGIAGFNLLNLGVSSSSSNAQSFSY
ncbi:PREDICTED: uncharacterized protein LOC108563643 isoform X1 [Nicrophorus vespilloides]|uniref:Uncharacterized protein LOC108563643 isoform X1 n=1 Tax=Nicrophorus vespilloides TaxID=110193 RepID=A0ABM1MTH1_NICVS|nr:PREDICTED: uncharacterized protein LOC108563643 isoform X1 [Nicrophorus vespilloides]